MILRTSILLASILSLSFVKVNSQELKSITIDQFGESSRSQFDGDANAPKITAAAVQAGFNLQILAIAGVEKIYIKKNDSAYTESLLGDARLISGGKSYLIKPPVIAGKVVIKLVKGGQERLVTLEISNSEQQSIGGGGSSGSCITISLPDAAVCTAMVPTNNYGEEATLYSNKTIMYIYDYKNGSFFRVKKIGGSGADKDQLKTEVVNLNAEYLKPNDDVHFRVVNVNRFMYNVSIADSVLGYDSEPSALFSKLFIGDSTFLGNLIGAYGKGVGIQSTDPTINVKSLISCFVNNYNILHNRALAAFDPCATFPCCYSVDYLLLANQLAAIRNETAGLQTDMDKIQKAITDNTKKLADCEKNLETTAKGCTEIDNKSYQAEIDKNNKILLDFNTINAALNNLPSDKDLKKLIVFLRNMVSQSQTYSLDHVSLNGNVLQLKINVTPKDSVFTYFGLDAAKKDPYNIYIPILWKSFVSFSSGSFMAVSRNLQNKTYTWQPVIGSNNTVDSAHATLVEQGYSTVPMGFSALGSIQWKFGRSIGIGASVGVGLTIESTPRLAYLAGGSLFLGDTRQFVITWGIAAMQVNRLTSNYQSMADRQVVYASKPSIEYYKERKVGMFISLTYTPFKTSKSR